MYLYFYGGLCWTELNACSLESKARNIAKETDNVPLKQSINKQISSRKWTLLSLLPHCSITIDAVQIGRCSFSKLDGCILGTTRQLRPDEFGIRLL